MAISNFDTDRLILRKFEIRDLEALYCDRSKAVVEQLKRDGIPYITATHDRNNSRSGGVMRQIGMEYRYSYEEYWQPKNFLVIFRMFQLNLDGQKERTYEKYWNLYNTHFIEKDI